MVPRVGLTDIHPPLAFPFLAVDISLDIPLFGASLIVEGAEGRSQQPVCSVGEPCITLVLPCITAALLPLPETWDLSSHVSHHSQEPCSHVSQHP